MGLRLAADPWLLTIALGHRERVYRRGDGARGEMEGPRRLSESGLTTASHLGALGAQFDDSLSFWSSVARSWRQFRILELLG